MVCLQNGVYPGLRRGQGEECQVTLTSAGESTGLAKEIQVDRCVCPLQDGSKMSKSFSQPFPIYLAGGVLPRSGVAPQFLVSLVGG